MDTGLNHSLGVRDGPLRACLRSLPSPEKRGPWPLATDKAGTLSKTRSTVTT